MDYSGFAFANIHGDLNISLVVPYNDKQLFPCNSMEELNNWQLKNDYYSSKTYFTTKCLKYINAYGSFFIVHRLFLFVIRFLTARWMLFILQIFNYMVSRKISPIQHTNDFTLIIQAMHMYGALFSPTFINHRLLLRFRLHLDFHICLPLDLRLVLPLFSIYTKCSH